MKFAMNGALTIGTLDGANIEIREEVGEENFFLFGLTADEVQATKSSGYKPRSYYESNEELRSCVDSLVSGQFSGGDPSSSVRCTNPFSTGTSICCWLTISPSSSARTGKRGVSRPRTLDPMSILNVARMGKFSSDRSIREYCSDIWRTWPVKIEFNS